MTIRGLNGIRALAVLAVVWHHTHPGYFLPSSHRGFLGVDVFFVLSGFLITTLLLEEFEASGRISLRDFYLRRSLRIFPLYYTTLLLLALQAAFSGSAQGRLFLAELPVHLAYLSNWIPTSSMMSITWSLSTEEQFYLLWPPLLALLGRYALWPLGMLLALNVTVLLGGGREWISHWVPAAGMLSILQVTFTPILIGVLLAYVLSKPRLFLPDFGVVAPLLALVGIANYGGDFAGWPRLAFHFATALTLASIVRNQGSLWVSFLEWKPLHYLGTISYGIYLLHKLAMALIQRVQPRMHDESPLSFFAVTLVATIVLAGCSYRMLERPFLQLKDRFRDRSCEKSLGRSTPVG